MTNHDSLPDWTYKAANEKGVTILENQAKTRTQRNTVQLVGTLVGAWLVKQAIADGIIHPDDIEFVTNIIGPEGITAASLLLGAVLYTLLIRAARAWLPQAVPYLEGSRAFPIYMAKEPK